VYSIIVVSKSINVGEYGIILIITKQEKTLSRTFRKVHLIVNNSSCIRDIIKNTVSSNRFWIWMKKRILGFLVFKHLTKFREQKFNYFFGCSIEQSRIWKSWNNTRWASICTTTSPCTNKPSNSGRKKKMKKWKMKKKKKETFSLCFQIFWYSLKAL